MPLLASVSCPCTFGPIIPGERLEVGTRHRGNADYRAHVRREGCARKSKVCATEREAKDVSPSTSTDYATRAAAAS